MWDNLENVGEGLYEEREIVRRKNIPMGEYMKRR